MSGDVTVVQESHLDELLPGSQIRVNHAGMYRSPFIGIVTDPSTAEAVMRPGPGGQMSAGWRDAKTRVGSRPFAEGAELHTVDSGDVDESDITWGILAPGRELVMQNLEGSGKTIFLGLEIEDITGVQPHVVVDANLTINTTGCEFALVWVEIHGYVDPKVVMEECRRVGAINSDEGDEDYVVQFMVGPNADEGYDAVPEERLIEQLNSLR